MAEAQVLVQHLLASQNSDGGWPYYRGTSWAEPTAFALLALQSEGNTSLSAALHRGTSWLLSQQRLSGGWAPNPSVAECTSVTSVVSMAMLASSPRSAEKAIDWTATQVYRDELSLSLLLAKTFHLPAPHAPGSVPWYPGTAGWVIPTCFTVLALLKAARSINRPAFHALAQQCCLYVVSRRCDDNGWNHGGSQTRSEDAASYPETTGLALLALRAASVTPPPESVSLAARFALAPQSVEGLSWLQMALQSPGSPVPDPQPLPSPRTNRDAALRLIALHARAGENILLSA